MDKPKRPNFDSVEPWEDTFHEAWREYADDMDQWLAKEVLPVLWNEHERAHNRYVTGPYHTADERDPDCSACRLIAQIEEATGE